MIIEAPRRPDWRACLSRYVHECSAREAEIGVHDCALFPATAFQVQTGIDPAAEFRGRYRTRIGWGRALKRYGAGNLIATFRSKMKEYDAPAAARLGDVVLVFADGEIRGGLRMQSQVLCVAERGLRDFGLDTIKHAFKVGL